jgi:hypothetical protein
LDSLADDSLLALASICTEFRKFDVKAGHKVEFHEDYLSTVAIFISLASTRGFALKLPPPAPGANTAENINNIVNYFSQNEASLIQQLNSVYLARESDKYAARFESDSVYVFPDDDYNRI